METALLRMKIRAKIEGADRVSAEFKEARRDIQRRTRDGLRKAAEQVVEPRAKAASPAFTRTFITTRATTRYARITTQGSRRFDRALGLLNFGGVVKAPIKPKKKLALTIGNTGEVRAAVKKPRRYPPRLFLNKAVERSIPDVERVMLPSLMRAFDGLDHDP